MTRKLVIILAIILVAVICTAGVIVAINNANSDTPVDTPDRKMPVFSGDSGVYKAPRILGLYKAPGVPRTPETPGATPTPEQTSYIAVPGWASFTIPANKTDVTVDFFNPETNEGKYLMTFELCLADGESLYQSGLVKAGNHIQNITLSRGLPAGTYDAYVHIQPYTADDDLVKTNNANMKLQLIVV